MVNLTWQTALAQSLRQLRISERGPRVALVGIGNELYGDDAAGVLLARALKREARREAAERRQQTEYDRRQSVGPPPSAVSRPRSFLVLDAGCAPENVTGTLRRFGPDLVVLADAAQMGEAPGTVRWLVPSEAVGLSASTHTLPLHVLARYLEAELGCAVALLAIQPAQSELGAPLSPAVAKTIACICRGLNERFAPMYLASERQSSLASPEASGP